MIYSFAFFLLLFVAVGVASMRYRQPTTEDYLLASKNIKPWMAGFSTFATSESGFMFVGYIGIAYAMGLSGILIIGSWHLGQSLMLWYSGAKIRAQNEVTGSQTYSGLLANWTGEEYKIVRIVSALLILVFMAVYAAAQLNAGGKALTALAGWNLNLTAIIGFVIVLLYCLAGGIRASIWTDSIQAIVMLISLALIVGFSLLQIGGVGALFEQLRTIDPALVTLSGGDYKFGLLGFIAGWVFGGVSVLGQAHIMVRFMALDKAENGQKAALWFAGLVFTLVALCTLAAVCARVLMPELLDADPEMALPLLSAEIMPGILSGLFLAGLFAAAMSSADSQILSSSAALTRDLVPKYRDKLIWSKIGTLLIASLALGIALSGNKNVFQLTTYAWAAMGAGMGPLLLTYIWNGKPSQTHAIIMMIGGVGTTLLWDYLGLGGDLYNVLPGFLVGLSLYFVPVFFIKKKQ